MKWSCPGYEDLARLVAGRTGLSFTPGRRSRAEEGIRRAMARAGVADPARYRGLVATEDNILDDLIAELTVGETYFFREPGQFQFLKKTVLPEIRQRRGGEHTLRAWSAGCATGEEAYSLAIALVEAGHGGRSHLLATDLSRAALAKATQATYGSWSLRGEGAEAASPYLRRQGAEYVVDPAIRSLVTFEYLNLADDTFPSRSPNTGEMDLILCRNVLIYLDRETVHAVAHRLLASLAEGGWLVAASSDPPLTDEAPFEAVVTDYGVFYRRRAALASTYCEASSPTLKAQAAAPRATGVVPGEGQKEPNPADSDEHAAGMTRMTEGSFVEERNESIAEIAMRLQFEANRDPEAALRGCVAATTRYPFSSELHFLQAVLLIDMGRDQEAVGSVRRAIYLDRTLAVAHFTMGSILTRLGDRTGARRAYRNARNLCAGLPTDRAVPLSEGQSAGRLAEAASAQIDSLDSVRRAP